MAELIEVYSTTKELAVQLEPQEGMWDLRGDFARQNIPIIVYSNAELCGAWVKFGEGQYINIAELNHMDILGLC